MDGSSERVHLIYVAHHVGQGPAQELLGGPKLLRMLGRVPESQFVPGFVQEEERACQVHLRQLRGNGREDLIGLHLPLHPQGGLIDRSEELVRARAVGDVSNDAQDRVVAAQDHPGLEVPEVSVRGRNGDGVLQELHLARAEHVRDRRFHLPGERGGEDLADVLAQEGLRGHREKSVARGVVAQKDAVSVYAEHHVGNGVQDGPVLGLAGLEFVLGTRVLDREADLLGNELQHLLVGLAELVPVVVALNHQRADDLTADAERHAQPDERRRAHDVDYALLRPLVELFPGHQERRLVLDEVAREGLPGRE